MAGVVMTFEIEAIMPVEKISIRLRRKAGRAAFKAAAEHFHKEILRQRFKQTDSRRLGYQSRDSKYTQRKQRAADRRRKWYKKKGDTGQAVKGRGRVDNLLTGEFRKAVISRTTIKAFPTRATLKVDAPPYMTNRPRGNRPWSWGEITRRTPEENTSVLDVLGTVLLDELTKRPERKTKKIK